MVFVRWGKCPSYFLYMSVNNRQFLFKFGLGPTFQSKTKVDGAETKWSFYFFIVVFIDKEKEWLSNSCTYVDDMLNTDIQEK